MHKSESFEKLNNGFQMCLEQLTSIKQAFETSVMAICPLLYRNRFIYSYILGLHSNMFNLHAVDMCNLNGKVFPFVKLRLTLYLYQTLLL